MSTDVAVSASPSCQAKLPPLPDDPVVLKQMVVELLDTLSKTQHERDGLQHRLDQLLRKMFGPRAERFDPSQPWLFPELQALAATEPTTTETAAAADDKPSKPKRKGHGRNGLPKDLPRETVVLELPEAQRLCPDCGNACQKFGEEISEQLDFKPSSAFVRQFIRHKYACTRCHDHVTVAAKPPQPIAKGLPGAGLLSYVATSKYTDHLPLHRLERILRRHGVALSRSTMCGWMLEVANLVRPLVDTMAALLLQSNYLHTDATKMPFQDQEQPGRTQSGQLWVYLGGRASPFNLFDFTRDHTATGIVRRLQNFAGYLHADAHNVYDQLFRPPSTIVEVGCWVHCRRNFFEAKDSDPARAHEALARIRRLYQIEAEAKELIAAQELTGDAADAVRYQLRQENALVELTSLRQWLVERQPQVLPKSPMGQAIQYAFNHWEALTRYTAAGFLDIDNNPAEQALRAVVLGRRNWLFAGSARGAETAATLFSLTSTCTRHKIDVFAYLQDVIQRLSQDSTPDVDTLRRLLPDRWQPQATNSS